MMIRRGQTSMPDAGFEPTVSAPDCADRPTTDSGRTTKKTCHHYKDQLADAVEGNNRCVLCENQTEPKHPEDTTQRY
jgi:hypothetical protein